MGFIDAVCVLSFLIYISSSLTPGIIPIAAFRWLLFFELVFFCCRHNHQGEVRQALGILQIKVPDTTSLPFPFTNYLYSTLSFPFVDS